MSIPVAAVEHARGRAALAAAMRREARRLWGLVDAAAISQTWAGPAATLVAYLTTAQFRAASMSSGYLDRLGAPAGEAVNPASLAGVASDGRSLETLLTLPAIKVKQAIGQGRPAGEAMAAGRALVELAAHTQVADAGRVADSVTAVARRQTGYTRMIVGKTCSRCLILAGRWYRWNAGFNRHPKCDCIGIPVAEGIAGSLVTDPNAAFRAMGRTEQDRVFGKAGAEAIRSGADIAQVVNARSGMTTADGRLYTRTGAGRRPRLMPEQIYREARGSQTEAIRLLRLHGYLR